MTHIITGVYGSGKTEFAVNLAINLAANQAINQAINMPDNIAANSSPPPASTPPTATVTLADLDIVNPFFRSREREADLLSKGVEVAGSAIKNHVSQDIPAVSYGFKSQVAKGQPVVIDLAGGEGGLRLLSGMKAEIKNAANGYQFLVVVNPFRPESRTVDKIYDFCQTVEAQVGGHTQHPLSITGLVNNGNMIGQTTSQHLLYAQEMVQTVAHRLGVPLAYTFVQNKIFQDINQFASQQVLTFDHLQMRKNWQF